MKILIHLILLVVLVVSCKERMASPEQYDRYESYQEQLSNEKENLHFFQSQGDSGTMILNDVLTLGLDELVVKHQMTKDDIPQFLNSLSVTVDLLNVFDKLNSPFDIRNTIISNSISEMESTINQLESDNTFENISIDPKKNKVIVLSYDTTNGN